VAVLIRDVSSLHGSGALLKALCLLIGESLVDVCLLPTRESLPPLSFFAWPAVAAPWGVFWLLSRKKSTFTCSFIGRVEYCTPFSFPRSPRARFLSEVTLLFLFCPFSSVRRGWCSCIGFFPFPNDKDLLTSRREGRDLFQRLYSARIFLFQKSDLFNPPLYLSFFLTGPSPRSATLRCTG